jgi:hypothetical protein
MTSFPHVGWGDWVQASGGVARAQAATSRSSSSQLAVQRLQQPVREAREETRAMHGFMHACIHEVEWQTDTYCTIERQRCCDACKANAECTSRPRHRGGRGACRGRGTCRDTLDCSTPLYMQKYNECTCLHACVHSCMHVYMNNDKSQNHEF